MYSEILYKGSNHRRRQLLAWAYPNRPTAASSQYRLLFH
jgi:hypothetical protein